MVDYRKQRQIAAPARPVDRGLTQVGAKEDRYLSQAEVNGIPRAACSSFSSS